MDEPPGDPAGSTPSPRQLDVSGQWDVVRWVRAQSPLVFYALAFIALNTFAGVALFAIEPASRIWFASFALLVDLALFAIVAWLNVHHHQKLVMGEWSQFRLLLALFGTREHPVDASDAHRLPSVIAPPPPDQQQLSAPEQSAERPDRPA
jgi:drug/metabolite transporter superfamily protein YnfA